ncbi:MAG: hypothetical protein DRI46_06640 [Chloroflexi bacterium]|nr:MAG: hypothetical protein DRI46_06640 [Chloroflexota bacterium]
MEPNIEKSSNVNIEGTVDLDAIRAGKVGAEDFNTETDPDKVDPEKEIPEPPIEEVKPPENNVEEKIEEIKDEEKEEEGALDEDILDLNEKGEEKKEEEEEKKEEEGKEADFIKIGDTKVEVKAVVDELSRLKTIEDAILEDDFLLGFIKHYDAGGDPAEFVGMVKTDYKEMSDLQLLKHDFDRENSDIEGSVRERMFAVEMKQKFGYDVSNNEYLEDALDLDEDILKAKLSREARKLRAKRIEEQDKYKSSATKGPVNENRKDYSQLIEELHTQVDQHQHTKDFSESGFIPVEVGDMKFGLKIKDPKKIIEMAANNGEFMKLFGFTQDGVSTDTDLMKFYKVASMAEDIEGYNKKLISIGRTLERRERMKEGKNLLNKEHGGGGTPIEQKESPKRELLKAFAEKGTHYTI